MSCLIREIFLPILLPPVRNYSVYLLYHAPAEYANLSGDQKTTPLMPLVNICQHEID